MGLEFTRIFSFKTDSTLPLDPDDQVTEFVKLIDGKIKNWQVLAPNGNYRILYYEMVDGASNKQVDGSQLETRLTMTSDIKKAKKMENKK